ncbi:MAG: GFA family protein [Gammaproteobacteria bacterium]
MSHSKREGHCLCGRVTITAEKASDTVCACHCQSCRRWSGGPYIELECGDAVAFSGDEHIRVYDSSEWADRGFCGHCGTHLFYRLKAPGHYMVPVGLFTTDNDLAFERQVFVDEKPHYYDFANSTDNLTGAELFAKFGASD